MLSNILDDGRRESDSDSFTNIKVRKLTLTELVFRNTELNSNPSVVDFGSGLLLVGDSTNIVNINMEATIFSYYMINDIFRFTIRPISTGNQSIDVGVEGVRPSMSWLDSDLYTLLANFQYSSYASDIPVNPPSIPLLFTVKRGPIIGEVMIEFTDTDFAIIPNGTALFPPSDNSIGAPIRVYHF